MQAAFQSKSVSAERIQRKGTVKHSQHQIARIDTTPKHQEQIMHISQPEMTTSEVINRSYTENVCLEQIRVCN